MRWGPHLRGGPRLQFSSQGQETGKGCQGKPRGKKKHRDKQDTNTQTRRTRSAKGGGEAKGGENVHPLGGDLPGEEGTAWGYGEG